MEARSYARSAPQLRNRLTLNDRGDIDGVEGTQQLGGMQEAQMELEMDSPGGGSEGSTGLDILSQVAGSNRSDTDDGEQQSQEFSQELL